MLTNAATLVLKSEAGFWAVLLDLDRKSQIFMIPTTQHYCSVWLIFKEFDRTIGAIVE